jgi:hypothetical protein
MVLLDMLRDLVPQLLIMLMLKDLLLKQVMAFQDYILMLKE